MENKFKAGVTNEDTHAIDALNVVYQTQHRLRTGQLTGTEGISVRGCNLLPDSDLCQIQALRECGMAVRLIQAKPEHATDSAPPLQEG